MNYTKTQHSTPYASISPTLPHLSAAHKTVLIAGASSGIAQATARAFLAAGTRRLVLVSRRHRPPPPPQALPSLGLDLDLDLEAEFPDAKILRLEASVLDPPALDAAFRTAKDTFGAGGADAGDGDGAGAGVVDVVVNCAGYQPALAPLAGGGITQQKQQEEEQEQEKEKDWWTGFEVNVRGAATLARVVVARAAPGAVLLQLGTAGAFFPAQLPMSGYAVSKLALVKLMEYVGAENPGLRVITVHPGIVPETEGGKKMVAQSGIEWPGDDINLPAHFLVWAASDEAKFLKNKFVFANWDVDEMKAREQEIAGSSELMIGLNGFPRNVE